MAARAFPGVKRIFFDRIFERSYWVWRKHPTIIVPSMLGTAVSVIEQSVITLALIFLLTQLAMQGLLPDFFSWVNKASGPLGVFLNPPYAQEIILLSIVSLVIIAFVAILGGGFVLSSEYGVYVEAWNSEKLSLGAVLENGARRWKPMAWTFFLTNLITWGPLALVYILLLVSASIAPSLSGLFLAIVSSSLFVFALIYSLVLALFTMYSYPAVVLGQASGLRAIGESFRTVSHNMGVSLTYSLVRILFQGLLTIIVLLAGLIYVPLSSLIAVILSLLLSPILHSTKTMIYHYANPNVPEMPLELSSPIWHDISRRLPKAAWLKVKTGLSEAGRLIISPRNLPFHLLSVLAFSLGVFLGNYVSTNGVASYLLSQGYQPGKGNPLVNQVVPPALGLDIFLNNWLVSIATGLAGIGFGAPSFVTILFNGFILGILVPLSRTTTMLLAAILPHGIIEIPSFILAGSMGIKLGYAAWRTRLGRGPESNGYLSKTLRETVYLVVGLAPLFLIAGLIEGDLTPIIMRMFGWTF